MNFQKSNVSFEDLAIEEKTPHEITTTIDLEKSTPKIEEVEEEDKKLAKFPGRLKLGYAIKTFSLEYSKVKSPENG